ncbi:hypothetical protein BM477_03695 [Boudabousia marimammalium]|uniref:Uncharacterized protein n=1 Tax=Boudabousia marimammalium TaxID=156892 RepID=A0A1Q5PR41_9ACTO|nr:hypothetical protein BM477_03695 [Boudabousia marimammalium]
MILAVLDGAWDEASYSTLQANSAMPVADWRIEFSVQGEGADSLYQGAHTSPDVIAAWVQVAEKLGDTEEIQLVPAAIAEIPQIASLLANYQDNGSLIIYVTTSVGEAWRRLGLNQPGVPVGLGPIRATWLALNRARTEAWQQTGAIIIDSSHCEVSGQTEAIFSAIRAKISAS